MKVNFILGFERGVEKMCWVKCIGVWLLSDSIYSLILHWKETFWKDHSIRIVRLILSVILILYG